MQRLIEGGRGGMGSLFKVLAISEPRLRELVGFIDEGEAAKAARS